MDESYFWIEVIFDLELTNQEKLKDSLKEADELTRVLSVSRKTAQTKIKQSSINKS